MKIKKLSRMPYAQAHVEIDANGNVYLFSYLTLVCSIVDGWLEVYDLYSMTTRKHIGAFMAEYGEYPNGDHGTYQTAKMCYDRMVRYNIDTGEIEDIV